jgi:sedoheptulokinase
MNNESRVLVNIGTSSQISIFSGHYEVSEVLGCRPYISGSYLLVGSPLCGGYAYHILRDFFIKTAELMGLTPPDDLYDRMNAAAEASKALASPPVVDTRYNGTREVPSIRGSITNIRSDTLLPGALCIGTLRGICDELHRFWLSIRERVPGQSFIVASGNGVRKNRVLQSVIASTFGMSVNTPVYTEEACCGAALFAQLVCGKCSSLEELAEKVRHTAI